MSPRTSNSGDVNANGKFSLRSTSVKLAGLDHSDDSRFKAERGGQPRKWAVFLVSSFAVSLLIGACSVIGGTLLTPFVFDAYSAARKQHLIQQMREIGDAMSAYHAVHGCYPASYVKVQNGQIGCSWRVLIAHHLQGVDVSGLPELSEPWNSPDNLRLGCTVPPVFVSPFIAAPPTRTETHVFAVMHLQSAISHPDCKKKSAKPDFVPGGQTRKRLLAVYLPNHTAHWAAPVDMTPKRLQDEVANITPEGPVVFLFTDGSIVALEKPVESF